MRVVSLNCSNTEIVCALGQAHQLVGVDDHSDYPEDVVRALPRVGRDLQIDVNKVAALRPDLVIASLTVPGHERIVALLKEAKLPFIAPEPVSLEDVYRDVREIAALLDAREQGEEVVTKMQAEVAAAAAQVSRPRSERPRIVVEWWPKPVIVPGAHSWVTDLIDAAGGVNPFADRPVKSEPLTPEAEDGLQADAAVISWCGVEPDKYRTEVVTGRSRWQHTAALRNGQVHCIAEAYLGRPGPRLMQGLRQLQAIVAGMPPKPATRTGSQPR